MAQALRVSLPGNGWQPRPDQMPLWAYLERGGRRADICAHRRWGKDDVCLHWAATAAHKRIGTYWHMLPEANQARKAIWDAINPRTGKRRINEAFPLELRATTKEQEMMIVLKCGSTWQVLGSDNYDSFVGSPPIGVTFSEWALAKPQSWSYIRPILLENQGWAFFIWTPRGRNHATRAFEARERDPNWFTSRIPAAKAVDPDDPFCKKFEALTPVFTSEQLTNELKELIDEAGSEEEGHSLFNTEYLVDFDAAVPGSYYGVAMKNAITSGRIGSVPYDPRFKVDTAWDLGIDDYLSIWFFQRINAHRLNVIDFYETSGVGLDTVYAEAMAPKTKLGWKWGMHYFPHDVQKRELGAGGRSIRQTAMSLNIRPIRVGVARDPAERINATRRMLPFCWFDEEACRVGIDHLKQYRKAWNQSMLKFMGPLHNQDSHAADAIGEFAVNATFPKVTAAPANENKGPKPPIRGFGLMPRRKIIQVPGWKVA